MRQRHKATPWGYKLNCHDAITSLSYVLVCNKKIQPPAADPPHPMFGILVLPALRQPLGVPLVTKGNSIFFMYWARTGIWKIDLDLFFFSQFRRTRTNLVVCNQARVQIWRFPLSQNPTLWNLNRLWCIPSRWYLEEEKVRNARNSIKNVLLTHWVSHDPVRLHSITPAIEAYWRTEHTSTKATIQLHSPSSSLSFNGQVIYFGERFSLSKCSKPIFEDFVVLHPSRCSQIDVLSPINTGFCLLALVSGLTNRPPVQDSNPGAP